MENNKEAALVETNFRSAMKSKSLFSHDQRFFSWFVSKTILSKHKAILSNKKQ